MSAGNILLAELLDHRVVVLGGPMMSGKTDALLDLEETLHERNMPYALYRAVQDTRSRSDKIVSHNGRESIQPATPISRLADVWGRTDVDFHLISEVSLLPYQNLQADLRRIPTHQYVFAEGFDYWSDGTLNHTWFSVARTGRTLRTTGICELCRNPSTHTLRRHPGPLLQIGGPETYLPVCPTCFNTWRTP